MSLRPDQWPVVIGVGECIQRGKHLPTAMEPLQLMETAVLEAQRDAGVEFMSHVDRLDVIQQVSWPAADLPDRLAARLHLNPGYRRYWPIGGETPIAALHGAAQAVFAGESACAVVVGGEAQYSVNAAAGQPLPWSARDDAFPIVRGADHQPASAVRLGLSNPAHIYPLFENAAVADLGLTPAEAMQESAELWARFSQVAARHPTAWSQRAYSAAELSAVSPDNRAIAWPYAKRMVANPAVNQSAAMVVTSQAQALAWGIDPSRLVYVLTGAAAHDPDNVMARGDLARSPGRDAVLDAMQQRMGDVSRCAALELYSCFPVVPKLARRRLGLAADRPMTVAGGLSFFGAPLNNYMTHAVAAMVRQLRASQGDARGILYGQGGYMTKHHAVALGRVPGDVQTWLAPVSVQAQADAARGPAPEWLDQYSGPAQVETFTVLFERNGAVAQGVVVLRTQQSQRLVAKVERSDTASLSCLMSPQVSPVGVWGEVHNNSQGVPVWCANPTSIEGAKP